MSHYITDPVSISCPTDPVLMCNYPSIQYVGTFAMDMKGGWKSDFEKAVKHQLSRVDPKVITTRNMWERISAKAQYPPLVIKWAHKSSN